MNVASRLTQTARLFPDQLAIATAVGRVGQRTHRAYRTISFRDLDARSSSIAVGLNDIGIGPGKKIALLVRFGEDFIALVFALLKSGATMILIDPGMGRRNVLRCLEETNPDGFIAIPMAHTILRFFGSRFPNATHRILVGRWVPGLPTLTLQRLERYPSSAYQDSIKSIESPAAIIFTTGSTGPPKGVLYTHQTFQAQIDLIAQRYEIVPGGRDLSCFPLFGLFNAVMGTSTILPDMDPTRPAYVDPPRLLDAIEQWEIRQSFGSPALWTRMGQYCDQHNRRMESLKLVLSAGAPVPPRVLRTLRDRIHPDGRVFTPYGATEALPIASIESREVLGETAELTDRGMGTCVGKRFDSVNWAVIKISDDPMRSIEEVEILPRGQIGELMVRGPMVSKQYVTRIDQNALHKIQEGDQIWHRMGDVGYLDDHDRFWFCGRKSHRLITSQQVFYTEQVEAIANTHPMVYRSALVGTGPRREQTPLLILEPWDRSHSQDEVVRGVARLLAENPRTRDITRLVTYP
ncbi:MAG: AMP-binding protein, partial [Planctomycetes bacterium]|nr:AMP-binding protein [Planctomycetota bacterium]